MVPRFPPLRSGKGWRGATSTTPRWRGTFSLIHPVLRKRTTQALTSPERSIDLAPCCLDDIVATPWGKARILEIKRKKKERKKRKKNRYPLSSSLPPPFRDTGRVLAAAVKNREGGEGGGGVGRGRRRRTRGEGKDLITVKEN
ncbi:hypothetical protein ALC56_08844 [Trachymyrmex septentrionalis]|uniref:Uncharacterized protein n=1 Tax=Trachymyrmex septentrionalis TaxID=34720 RepID=A0A195F9D5_9HYME|nr:hypothetical protein ALC56_08844 [Trachymyrmex septentrionalis]